MFFNILLVKAVILIKYLIVIFSAAAIACAMFTGKISDLSSSIVSSCEDAVSLFLSLLGIMAFWGGIMNIAKKSGLTDRVSSLLSPLLGLIFKGINKTSSAFSAITLNITANILGLGNAATPLGIEAMKELKKEEGKRNTATKNIALLTIFNTASIQIVPTTIAAIRSKYGSENPMEIILPVIFTSLLSLIIGIVFINLFYIKRNRHEYN